MKHQDIPSAIFAALGLEPSETFPSPNHRQDRGKVTRRVARTEQGLWLMLLEAEDFVQLEAYPSENDARGTSRQPEESPFNLSAEEADEGEHADPQGNSLTFSAQESPGLDVHSPEFSLIAAVVYQLDQLRRQVGELTKE